MPTATQLTVTRPDVNGVRCQALFCSGRQPSDAPATAAAAAVLAAYTVALLIAGWQVVLRRDVT